MGKKSPSAPAAPDPGATARAQSALNKETAITQAQLDRQVSYAGPYGQVQYVRTDDGTAPYEQGKFEQRVTLTPEGQALQAQELALDKQMNQLALDQTGRVSGILSNPVDFNNATSIEDTLYAPVKRRLDDRYAQQEEAMRARLANQGITSGSDAYNNEMRNFEQGRNDAYGSATSSARAQAVQELLAQRNQPINEITALMNGGQVNVPQFMPQQAPNVGASDITGPTALQYQGQLAGWNAQQQAQNSMMGGLASLGGRVLGSLPYGKWF